MDVVFDRVAGLDVGKASVTVCVRTPGEGGKRKVVTRTFARVDPLACPDGRLAAGVRCAAGGDGVHGDVLEAGVLLP